MLVLLASPGHAGAQQRTPTPSASELWRDYPLYATPEARVRPTAQSAAVNREYGSTGVPRRTTAIAAQHRGGGGATTVMLALIALVGVVAIVLAWVRAGPWGSRIEGIGDFAAHEPPAPAQEGTARQLSAAPPDPQRAWNGEVEWRDTPSGPRFIFVASAQDGSDPVALTESDALDWPPVGPASVAELNDAVQRLASAAADAGWTPAPSGRAWYAKRFTWQPPTRGLSTGRFKSDQPPDTAESREATDTESAPS
jgi:hypothetical protein